MVEVKLTKKQVGFLYGQVVGATGLVNFEQAVRETDWAGDNILRLGAEALSEAEVWLDGCIDRARFGDRDAEAMAEGGFAERIWKRIKAAA